MRVRSTEKGRISAALPVELPGIELGAEISVTCGNAEVDDVKQRETTCRYAKGVDGINMFARSATPRADRQTPAIRPSPTRSQHKAYARTWRVKRPICAASKRLPSGVAGCFLSELHTRRQAEFGVDVGEVGLDSAR